MIAIRQSADKGFFAALKDRVAGPAVTCPNCSETFNFYCTPGSIEAAEKMLVDYLRRSCPRHVEFFGADERANGNHCHQCMEAYDFLGLRHGVEEEEIKAAYRNLAKKCHPDRLSEKDERLRQEAEDQFIGAAKAYKHLNNHAVCGRQ